MTELVRLGNAAFRKSDSQTYLVNDDSAEPDEKIVRSMFYSFGHGALRTSDFAVELKWGDIQTLIGSFVEMNHPEALRMQAALRLAEAAEQAGWSASDLPKMN